MGPAVIMPWVPHLQRDVCPPTTICVAPSCPTAMLRSKAWSVEDYELVRQLYRGKASLLYEAVCRQSGTTVALKLYRKHKLSDLNWYQVAREIRIHSTLQHENIIQLYAAFEDAKHVCLVQEYASGGDLYEDLKRSGGQFKEAHTAAGVLAPCMRALLHMHGLGIVHRDIKPENILLAADRTVKLADFGLSINAEQERPVTRAGTLDYMAPEVLVCPEKSRPEENKEKALLGYTRAVDGWAMGVLAYELLVGRPPFEQETRAATYENIMYRKPNFPIWMSSPAKDFITVALTKAAKNRPGMVALLGHKWIDPAGCALQRFADAPISEATGAASPPPTRPGTPQPTTKRARPIWSAALSALSNSGSSTTSAPTPPLPLPDAAGGKSTARPATPPAAHIASPRSNASAAQDAALLVAVLGGNQHAGVKEAPTGGIAMVPGRQGPPVEHAVTVPAAVGAALAEEAAEQLSVSLPAGGLDVSAAGLMPHVPGPLAADGSAAELIAANGDVQMVDAEEYAVAGLPEGISPDQQQQPTNGLRLMINWANGSLKQLMAMRSNSGSSKGSKPAADAKMTTEESLLTSQALKANKQGDAFDISATSSNPPSPLVPEHNSPAASAASDVSLASQLGVAPHTIADSSAATEAIFTMPESPRGSVAARLAKLKLPFRNGDVPGRAARKSQAEPPKPAVNGSAATERTAAASVPGHSNVNIDRSSSGGMSPRAVIAKAAKRLSFRNKVFGPKRSSAASATGASPTESMAAASGQLPGPPHRITAPEVAPAPLMDVASEQLPHRTTVMSGLKTPSQPRPSIRSKSDRVEGATAGSGLSKLAADDWWVGQHGDAVETAGNTSAAKPSMLAEGKSGGRTTSPSRSSSEFSFSSAIAIQHNALNAGNAPSDLATIPRVKGASITPAEGSSGDSSGGLQATSWTSSNHLGYTPSPLRHIQALTKPMNRISLDSACKPRSPTVAAASQPRLLALTASNLAAAEGASLPTVSAFAAYANRAVSPPGRRPAQGHSTTGTASINAGSRRREILGVPGSMHRDSSSSLVSSMGSVGLGGLNVTAANLFAPVSTDSPPRKGGRALLPSSSLSRASSAADVLPPAAELDAREGGGSGDSEAITGEWETPAEDGQGTLRPVSMQSRGDVVRGLKVEGSHHSSPNLVGLTHRLAHKTSG